MELWFVSLLLSYVKPMSMIRTPKLSHQVELFTQWHTVQIDFIITLVVVKKYFDPIFNQNLHSSYASSIACTKH